MSHTLSEIISCANIQDQLNQHFLTQANPLDAKEKQAFTDEFVMSPFNTNGMLQNKMNPGRGKKRVVQLLYTPPVLEDEIGTSPAKKCTSSNEAGQLSEEYELSDDEGTNYDEKFDLVNMSNMCEDNALWVAGRIQAMLDGLTKKMGTVNANQIALLTGNFGTGEANVAAKVKTIATRDSSDKFVLRGYSKIVSAAENAGYQGAPILFGWGEIKDYLKELKAGCCAIEGVDISAFAAQNELIFMADKKIQTALGNSNFLTLSPGAVQLVQWLEFEGEKGINVLDDDSYKQTVITNPKTGIRYDLQIKNDCGNIIINIKLAHKLVGLPDDMFSTGDAFRGVKWVNEFAITNPALS